jgi:alpha-1,6-mannosyltransferase
MQAIHDFLFHRGRLDAYDHHAFPGVVPRTFLAPAALAALASPVAVLLHAGRVARSAAGVAARAALASLSILALARLRGAVGRVWGKSAGVAFLLICALQFHLPFYASRTLPNTYAVALTALAAADWLDGSAPLRAVAILAGTVIAVRCDVAPLAAAVGVHMLVTRAVRFRSALTAAAAAGAASAAVSVAFDSLLWRRLLWPEGSVLWFNTALNKSSEWGVSPWHWYWSSALPRALAGTAPLAAAGAALDARARGVAAVALAFIAAYSFLPHKELRFILPAVPLLNVVAGVGVSRALGGEGDGGGRKKRTPPHLRHRARRAVVLAFLAAAAAATVALTSIASAAAAVNYPGGVALARLHALGGVTGGKDAPSSRNSTVFPPGLAWPPTVHIDVAAAQTGVTRFGQVGEGWTYLKTEGLTPAGLAGAGVTHLLSGAPAVPGFVRVEGVDGFAGVGWPAGKSPVGLLRRLREGRAPWEVWTGPAIYIHRRVVEGEE